MDIYPQDLGYLGYTLALQVRTRGWALLIGVSTGERIGVSTGDETRPFTPEALTPLRRLWLRGCGVDDDLARYARPAFDLFRRLIHPAATAVGAVLIVPLLRWVTGDVEAGTIFGGIAGVSLLLHSYWAGVAQPRRTFRDIHRPLRPSEVQQMTEYARDPLAVEFLSLVRVALATAPAPENGVGPETRAALRHLGRASRLCRRRRIRGRTTPRRWRPKRLPWQSRRVRSRIPSSPPAASGVHIVF